MPISKDIRRQIVVLARRPSARRTEFSTNRPTKWKPWDVSDPSCGHPFTNDEAWELIARYAEEGHEITAIKLEKPLGATGYVMNITLDPEHEDLYVKLELDSGRIWGRSFHYSEVRGE